MSDSLSYHSQGCTAWNIYAEELRHHGYGYPLWMPDPDPSVTEVQLGDVGWIHNGGFYQMFNSMKAEGEPQIRNAVPSGFESFCPPTMAIVGPRDEISQPILCGRSIKQVDVDVEAAASAFASASFGGSAGIKFGFKSTSDRGAFLALSPPSVSRQILSKKHIIDYIRANFDSWFEFANTTIGLGLKDEEILFVSGTMKTSRWAVAAFRGESQKMEGSFTADLGSLGQASVSVSVSSEMPPLKYYRTGPTSRSMRLPDAWEPDDQAPLSESTSLSQAPEPRDQCVFMNYYKVKRRFWKPLRIRAAATGHDGSGPGSEDGSDPESSFAVVDDSSDRLSTEECVEAKRYIDPVVYLLDYILEYSTASYAVACDSDISTLLGAQCSIEDIPSALADMRPVIVVDENGVGAIWPDSERGMLLSGTQYQPVPEYHSTSRPVTTLHHSEPSAPLTSSLNNSSIVPLCYPTSYYLQPVQTPPMSQPPPLACPYQPTAGAMSSCPDEPQPGDPASQPYTGQANYIVDTDDASTKLSDRVRRKCYNCRTTGTSTWRRSNLTPGKVLCNKCGLFERTHSRPRPVEVTHKRGHEVIANQFKKHRNTHSPPPPPHAAAAAEKQQPSTSADILPLAPHFSHMSMSEWPGIAHEPDTTQEEPYQSGGATEIGGVRAQSASPAN